MSDSGFIRKSKKELDGTNTMVLLCTSALWKPASCAQRSVFDGDIFPHQRGEKVGTSLNTGFFVPLVDGHQVGNLTPTFLFA